METKFKLAIENYQCSGCAVGCDISCFEKNNKISDFEVMFERLQINRFEIKDCIY